MEREDLLVVVPPAGSLPRPGKMWSFQELAALEVAVEPAPGVADVPEGEPEFVEHAMVAGLDRLDDGLIDAAAAAASAAADGVASAAAPGGRSAADTPPPNRGGRPPMARSQSAPRRLSADDEFELALADELRSSGDFHESASVAGLVSDVLLSASLSGSTAPAEPDDENGSRDGPVRPVSKLSGASSLPGSLPPLLPLGGNAKGDAGMRS